MKKKIILKEISINFIIILTFFTCKNNEDNKSFEVINQPTMIQENYRHYIYKSNKKYMVATIKYAEFYEKQKIINCDKINAEIFDSKGELSSKISSEKGKINQENKTLVFSGNVVLELFENDAKLYSDELELNYKDNKMVSKGKVLLEKEDGSFIKADSMESEIKSELTHFKNMEIRYFYDEDEDKDETK